MQVHPIIFRKCLHLRFKVHVMNPKSKGEKPDRRQLIRKHIKEAKCYKCRYNIWSSFLLTTRARDHGDTGRVKCREVKAKPRK